MNPDHDTAALRVPPHSIEAESSVLGGLLLDNQAWDRVGDLLTPSDFYFARDGIAAEGNFNQEQIVVSDVDLALLDERRVYGTVIPLNDKIKEIYDHVAVYKDKAEVTGKVLPRV